MTDRAPLTHPLTPAEERAVALLARGYTYRQVGEALGVSVRTATHHIRNAAMKIPSNLPVKMRVIHWFNGGDPVSARMTPKVE